MGAVSKRFSTGFGPDIIVAGLNVAFELLILILFDLHLFESDDILGVHCLESVPWTKAV